MREFFQKFGEGLRGLPTSNIGGRKLWGNFSRNLEKWFAWVAKKQYWRKETMGECFWKLGEMVCLDFQKAMLAGGSYGGIFLEIGRNCLRGLPKSNIFGRISWRNFSKKLVKRACVDFQKAMLKRGNYGGIFPEIGRNGLPGFPKSNVGGRKLWGNFSRNVEMVCVDFQKAMLAGETVGEFFLEIWRNCLPGFPTSNVGRRKLWGNFSRNFGRVFVGVQKSNVGGRKLWGNFSRNLGRVCVDCQKAIFAGGNYGRFFSRNLGRVCVGCQQAILAAGNYGGIFLEIWKNGLRGLPKSNIGGRKLWGNVSGNWEKWFAWISKKQCWREEAMGEFF